jgi:hypothetical protein
MPLMIRSPGVYRAEVAPLPSPVLNTGVPAFLGYATQGPKETPTALANTAEFTERLGAPLGSGYLADAVTGFFANGGVRCVVVRLEPDYAAAIALRRGLTALEARDDLDLVCIPDAVRPRGDERLPPLEREVLELQLATLEHCDRLGDRFALLDALPGRTPDGVLLQRRALVGTNGALYYPWLAPRARAPVPTPFVPPSSRVAGIVASTDRRVGVHKAPANESVSDIADLELALGDIDQATLNKEGVNCIRAFAGRGIRVWGARTLSRDANWRYVSVRRLFLTAGRWIRVALAGAVFEPNDPALWARVKRELEAFLTGLFEAGALRGGSPEEAFVVRCDADTNPPSSRQTAGVSAEVALAAAGVHELVVVRIVVDASGVAITESSRP